MSAKKPPCVRPCVRGSLLGNRAQGGFTLLEMLVVVAILAVLVGSVALGFQSFQGAVNLRNNKIELASYLRTVQRFAIAHRRVACVKVMRASSKGAEDDFVKARFIASTQSCTAPIWNAGEDIPGLGQFTPAKTVDINHEGASQDHYIKVSYTMTGTATSIYLSDEKDFDAFGDASAEDDYITLTLVSSSGRVEVFPCGRNHGSWDDQCD